MIHLLQESITRSESSPALISSRSPSPNPALVIKRPPSRSHRQVYNRLNPLVSIGQPFWYTLQSCFLLSIKKPWTNFKIMDFIFYFDSNMINNELKGSKRLRLLAHAGIRMMSIQTLFKGYNFVKEDN